jgi:hypothetical protein
MRHYEKIDFLFHIYLSTQMDCLNTIDLDTSLPISEVLDEDYIDYYIRMEEILQIERDALNLAEYQDQCALYEAYEAEQIEYYMNSYYEGRDSE